MHYYPEAALAVTVPILSVYWFMTVSIFATRFRLNTWTYHGNWMAFALFVIYLAVVPAISELFEIVFD